MTSVTLCFQKPGIFGKIAAHGDFVSRRLPPDFLGAWDRWLQHALQKSREQLGHLWLDVYLTSPVWRFAFTGGVCGEAAWAGVMIPSVDRVGRHFPLTIASSVSGQGVALDCLLGASDWYDALEGLALRTLDTGFSLDALDVELDALPLLSISPATDSAIDADATSAATASASPAARNCLQTGNAGKPVLAQLRKLGSSMTSLWWSEGSERVLPCVLACEGLPAPFAFPAMLDGCWARHRWQLHCV